MYSKKHSRDMRWYFGDSTTKIMIDKIVDNNRITMALILFAFSSRLDDFAEI